MTSFARSCRLAQVNALVAAFCILALSGCNEKPKAVEVVRPTESPKPREPISTPALVTRSVAPPVVTPVPAPTPIVLMARDMPITSGNLDSEGGVSLPFNGPIQIDHLPIRFPVGQVVLEMKGSPAGGVWPQVNLNTRNQTIQKNFLAMPKSFVTTSSYHLYRLPQKTPLPPGDYQVTFRFLNNQDLDGEDRSVALRKIEFHPVEPEEE